MVRAEYNPFDEKWETLFVDQFGTGEYFRGTRYQRSNGIGTILSSMLRLLVPAGKVIAREGLETTNRALTKMLEGQEPVEALKNESKKAVRRLLDKADVALKQRGMGTRRKRRAIASRKPPLKRLRAHRPSDIFETRKHVP